MASSKIHGAEYPLRKIFSNDFNFSIPLYQRPYSWSTEEAGELLDDVLDFIGDESHTNLEDLSPYFLGSIVLIKDESRPDAQVVDGQQRLTTLTILLSALRHAIRDTKFSNPMKQYLYEEGNPLEGNPNRYRLTLRDRDAEFFRSYVQDPGRLPALAALDPAPLTDSQRNIRENASLLLSRLQVLTDELRVRVAQFLVQNCLLVVVSTPDLDAAYRIFSILNDRGLDLSHSDILKSEIIGRIPTEAQSRYNALWENAEEELGRQSFADLFAHIRMIFRKQKMRESILKEFREYVVKTAVGPERLIDDVLVPFANAMATINTIGYESVELAERVNGWLRWLSRIDNTDWIPPALLLIVRHANTPKVLDRFLADLERLAAFMMLTRGSINERLDRYGKLISYIEEGAGLYTDTSPLQLTAGESFEFLRALNGDVYRLSAPRRTYILLRLDSALSDGSATYEHGVISIEHILPQNPREDSQWCKAFPSEDIRARWVHRIGNLVLLTHSKNSSASNFEFDRKKSSYFAKGGVSPFPLTTQVLAEGDWTPAVVERIQRSRLLALRDLWRLNVDLDEVLRGDAVSEMELEIAPSDRADFHLPVISVLDRHLGVPLKEQSNRTWTTPDGDIVVLCLVSKRYKNRQEPFWFSMTASAHDKLKSARSGLCAFGLGSPDTVVLLPFEVLQGQLTKLGTSPDKNGGIAKWHIEFSDVGDRVSLILRGGNGQVDVSHFVIKDHGDNCKK